MKKILFTGLLFLLFQGVPLVWAQNLTWKHQTWYDKSKTKLKETFTLKQGKDTSVHVLHGPYELYYDNGIQKASGFYKENEADSLWVYYYENGNTKCLGPKKHNQPMGYWRYYFESGGTSMEGRLVKNAKEGLWKFYYENEKVKKEGYFVNDKQDGPWTYFYEDGLLKATARFAMDIGYYKEFYPAGGPKAYGKIVNGQSDSIWTYYHPNGVLKARGVETNGLKTGYWAYYYENGNMSSEGQYKNGQTSGKWKYYYPSGKISAEGVDSAGVKDGYWKLFYETGRTKGEGEYAKGNGEYREFHENGKLKMMGKVKNSQNDGLWMFYYEDGHLEGKCEYDKGEGMFYGYYPSGSLKMQGILRNGEKIGKWNLYKEDGSLVGHLQTVYDLPQEKPNKQKTKAKDSVAQEEKEFVNPYKRKNRFRISYFEPRKNEYRSFAIGTNPLALILGSLPFYFEYYMQERMGLEINPILYREPLFTNEVNMPNNQLFKKGYALSFRHKFYNNNKDLLGLVYFGYELRYTHNTYLANVFYANSQRQISSNEDMYEFAVLFGDRLLKNYNKKGWTLDLFMGIGIGYRMYQKNYEDYVEFDRVFEGVRKSPITIPIRIGINAGYLF